MMGQNVNEVGSIVALFQHDHKQRLLTLAALHHPCTSQCLAHLAAASPVLWC